MARIIMAQTAHDQVQEFIKQERDSIFYSIMEAIEHAVEDHQYSCGYEFPNCDPSNIYYIQQELGHMGYDCTGKLNIFGTKYTMSISWQYPQPIAK